MACDQPSEQLMLYLDGALPPEQAYVVAQHLRVCPVCQDAAATHHRLRTLLQLPQPEDTVPTHLWPTIQKRLAQSFPQPDHAQAPRRRLWLSVGALAILLALAVSLFLWRPSPVPVVVQALVDSQIRTRLMSMPYHQLPADAAAIRRWFEDKMDFPILVPILPQERYVFLGTRVNYFLDRRVAEMAYTLETQTLTFVMFTEHGVNLATLPTMRLGQRTLYVQTHKGYTAVLWKDGEAVCGVVSDLQRPTLVETVRLAMAGMAGS